MVVQGAGARTDAKSAPAAASGCQLNSAKGNIKHVIYIQFDNTHFRRDNANVPSDLEQMPHLLNFMTNNGTLLTNDHTVLISHTAGGILSSLTGVYPDKHGQIVSNSNVRFNGTGFQFPSSFGYWTDPVTSTTTVPNMVTPTGQNAPAPWVPYTSAGCNFGAIATANTVLENTGTGPSGDMTKVFGNPSPQWTEAENARLLANTPANAKAKAQPQADFVGFAVHCAQGAALCASGQNDVLPDEPGGYAGYKGIFGAQQLNPILGGGTTMNDLAGQPIADPRGNPGFPGFDGMYASTSLAYVAAMQEHGIPITYAYISDAHDFHGVAGNQHVAFGPGSAGYVAQLKSYDDAFAAFFQRLATDGINKSNTLFVFTVDEGDHFAGVQKTNCDGVTVPCQYDTNQIGEVNANIDTLFNEQAPGVSVSGHRADGSPIFNFTVHGDDAPTFYLSGNPDSASAAVRNFERAAAGLTAANPYTGETAHTLMQAMADREEMKALHMYTNGDPLRDPTFTYFADPSYFLTDFPTSTCKTCINPLFAWNHGDIQPEIANTWLGFVGPGVQQNGIDGQVWSDHVDVAPTIYSLLGLTPNWQSDGRVLVQALDGSAVPKSLRSHRGAFVQLADAYKQLNAPFGSFGMDTLTASTKAIQTGSASSDSAYTAFDQRLSDLRGQRDALAAQISTVLNGAAFQGQTLDEHEAQSLIGQAQSLIRQAASLAGP